MSAKVHNSHHNSKAGHAKKAQHAAHHANKGSAQDKSDFKKAMNVHSKNHGNAHKQGGANHSAKGGGHNAKAHASGHGQHSGHNAKANGADHGQHGGHDAKANGASHGQHGGHNARANGGNHGHHADNANKAEHSGKHDGSNKAHDAQGKDGNKQADKHDGSNKAHNAQGKDGSKQADKHDGSGKAHNANGKDGSKQANKHDDSGKAHDAKGKDGNKQANKHDGSNKAHDAQGKDGGKQANKHDDSGKAHDAKGKDGGKQADKHDGSNKAHDAQGKDGNKHADKHDGADKSHNAQGKDGSKQANKHDDSGKAHDAKGKDGGKQADKHDGSNKAHDANGKDGNKQANKHDGSNKSENGKGHDGSSNVANVQFARTQRTAQGSGSAQGSDATHNDPSKPPISDKQERKIEREGQKKFHKSAQDQPDGSAVKEYDNLQHLQVENNDPNSSVYHKYANEKINKRLDKIRNDPESVKQINKAEEQSIAAATKDVTGKTPDQLAHGQQQWLESDKVQQHRDNLPFNKREKFTEKNLNKIMDFSTKRGQETQKNLLNHDFNLPASKKFKLAGPEQTFRAVQYGAAQEESLGRIIAGGVGSTVATGGRANRIAQVKHQWNEMSPDRQREILHAVTGHLVGGDDSALRNLRGKAHDVGETIAQGLDATADATGGVLATAAFVGGAKNLATRGGGARQWASKAMDGVVAAGTLSTAALTSVRQGRRLGLIGPNAGGGASPGNANAQRRWNRAQTALKTLGYGTDVGNVGYGVLHSVHAAQFNREGDAQRRSNHIGMATAYAGRGVLGMALRSDAVGWGGERLGRAVGKALGGGIAGRFGGDANQGANIGGYIGGQAGRHISETSAQAGRAVASGAAVNFYQKDRAEGQKQQNWVENSLLRQGKTTTPGTNYLNSQGEQRLGKLNQMHRGQIDQINKQASGDFIRQGQTAPQGSTLNNFTNLLKAKHRLTASGGLPRRYGDLEHINTQLDAYRSTPDTWGQIQQARQKSYDKAFHNVTGIQGHKDISDSAYGAWQKEAFGKNVAVDSAGGPNAGAKLNDYSVPRHHRRDFGLNRNSSPIGANIGQQDYSQYRDAQRSSDPADRWANTKAGWLKQLDSGIDPNQSYLTPAGKRELANLISTMLPQERNHNLPSTAEIPGGEAPIEL